MFSRSVSHWWTLTLAVSATLLIVGASAENVTVLHENVTNKTEHQNSAHDVDPATIGDGKVRTQEKRQANKFYEHYPVPLETGFYEVPPEKLDPVYNIDYLHHEKHHHEDDHHEHEHHDHDHHDHHEDHIKYEHHTHHYHCPTVKPKKKFDLFNMWGATTTTTTTPAPPSQSSLWDADQIADLLGRVRDTPASALNMLRPNAAKPSKVTKRDIHVCDCKTEVVHLKHRLLELHHSIVEVKGFVEELQHALQDADTKVILLKKARELEEALQQELQGLTDGV